MGMQLWDLVKYDLYYGMNPVAADDVDGQLALDQDKVLSVDEMFSLDWMHTFYDNLRGAAGKNGADLPLDQELFDTWTITIDGTVAEPYTENLTTLIAEAEEAGVVVTKPSKIHCDWDPIGGAIDLERRDHRHPRVVAYRAGRRLYRRDHRRARGPRRRELAPRLPA